MSTVSFKEQVTAWARRSKERMVAVRNESVQRVVGEMQRPGPSRASTNRAIEAGAGLGKVRKDGMRGVSRRAFGPVVNTGGTGNLPVDTGFLRASLVVGKGPLKRQTTTAPEKPGTYSWDAGLVSLALVNIPMEDTVEAIYTANYARVAEYGGPGRPARRFVALAAQKWPQIVNAVCAEARSRTTGSGFDALQSRSANGRFTKEG